MGDPELDRRLTRYLQDREAERIKGYTLESLYRQAMNFATWQGEHEARDKERHEEAMNAIASLSTRLANLESGRVPYRARLESYPEETTERNLVMHGMPEVAAKLETLRRELAEKENAKLEADARERRLSERVKAATVNGWIKATVFAVAAAASVLLEELIRRGLH